MFQFSVSLKSFYLRLITAPLFFNFQIEAFWLRPNLDTKIDQILIGWMQNGKKWFIVCNDRLTLFFQLTKWGCMDN